MFIDRGTHGLHPPTQSITHFVPSQQTYMVAVTFKDNMGHVDFVDPSSLLHDSLSFCYSSLGEQPPRRLWDNPVAIFKKDD